MITGHVDRPNGGPSSSLKAWAQLIGWLGIPGVLALGFGYVGATEIPRLARQNDQILTETRLLRERQEQTIELMNTLIRVTQRTCSNAARDDNARQRCFDR